MTLEQWRKRVEEWEAEVVADARLVGALPILDYAERPFKVPPEVEVALRERRDPAWRERRDRRGRTDLAAARKRRALAGMLREKGDEAGAARQDAAAEELEASAAKVDADLREGS